MLDNDRLKIELDKVLNWIKDYVESCHAKGVVIGNSGGKDSATVIAMAQKALGKDRVFTIAMPCNSIKEDLEDAKLVSKTFDVPFLELDITNTYNELENAINSKLEELDTNLSSESKVNIKPRLRMTSLYGIAQTLGCLVLGTGNLCERMVGYTTKWGDSAVDFNPIANFTVDEVLAIGKMLGVPEKIINKAPNDGLSKVTDEEKMGVTYKQIAEVIETGKTDDEEAMKIILNKNKFSKHKRKDVPFFKIDRKTYID